MFWRLLILMLLSAGAVVPAAALCPPQDVKCLVDEGDIMPFNVLRNRVVPQVNGEYIGAEYDAGTWTYRFRFMVDGRVINVDVDARTGQRKHATQKF